MKITNLQVSMMPWHTEGYKELRVCVLADGRYFNTSRAIREDDFECAFDFLMREAAFEIKRLVKKENS
jgi:hypothetical protein